MIVRSLLPSLLVGLLSALPTGTVPGLVPAAGGQPPAAPDGAVSTSQGFVREIPLAVAGPAWQPRAAAGSGDERAVTADLGVGTDRVRTEVIESEPFALVGLTWSAADADAAPDARFRTRTEAGWSGWTPLVPADDVPDAGTADAAGGVRAGTDPVWVGSADAVQVSFAADDAAPDGLALSLIDPGVEEPARSGDVASSTAAVPTDPTRSTQAVAAAPQIVTRAQWGAPAEPRCRLDVAPKLRGAVVHHTASTNAYASAADARAAIRGFLRYHTESRGWCDIGYNFLVDKWGNVYEGRAGSLTRAVVGVHAGGFNTGTLGVSMIGDYSTVAPSTATLDSVARVIAWRFAAYGLDPQGTTTFDTLGGENSKIPSGTRITLPTVFAHRDVGFTACPGNAGYAAMGRIRARAAELGDDYTATPQAGQVVALIGDQPVPGAELEIRDGTCEQVFSRMRTGLAGAFPVTAFPGSYCVVAVSVPPGYGLPARQPFSVAPGQTFAVRVQLATLPSQGSVVLSGGGVPVAGAVVEVRNGSCSTVFSRMRTGADGSFPVTANPGTYCLVPVSVPAGFA
ncbi:N-acetylmuramoyl-L-alanine amidase, partial [uncultured Cellulomonas sp.]|uniref:N-acetylmuramoyl-L-alanine amidase n=1 Tax=uncultured Cellulomonas sp. TaxID=189682 RepID=UPI0026277798